MNTINHTILNGSQITQIIKRIAYQIYESNSNEKEIILAGIQGNGMIFAQLLAKVLKSISPLEIQLC